MDKNSRLKGGIYGLLVGDALGVPYEFHPAADIPPHNFIDMTPPAAFRRAHPTVKPGTWSDDGALALCLLDSLLVLGKLDLTCSPRLVRQ
jgi:ADP-ribosylglycohydrolase